MVTTRPKTASDRRAQPAAAALERFGCHVDRHLAAAGHELWSGGEPTFTAVDWVDHPEWSTAPLGEEKERLGAALARAIAARLACDGMLMKAVWKSYPGEPVPRWAWTCLWRRDGRPLLAEDRPPEPRRRLRWHDARRLAREVVEALDIAPRYLRIARDRHGYGALVLPLLRVKKEGRACWASCRWTLAASRLRLEEVEAPAGLRLPLYELPMPAAGVLPEWPKAIPGGLQRIPANSIRVAMTIELRDDHLSVFIPPVSRASSFLDLVETVREVAGRCSLQVQFEGYAPPDDRRLARFQVTPDPGVLEVNLPPVGDWSGLRTLFQILYEEAEKLDLTPVKRQADGRLVCSGGGCHLTLGGPSPRRSPFVQRPDLLLSLLTYWNHHPGLSYLFCGRFVGPCSQAPRTDEGRPDQFMFLEDALTRFRRSSGLPPDRIARMLKHLLVDHTGNTHRAEVCIDKFWPEHDPARRLGVVELRAFAMPPTADLLLALALLLRSLTAWLLETPFQRPLAHWGGALNDRFMLPSVLEADLEEVLEDLAHGGFKFDRRWLQPLIDFHFPRLGAFQTGAVEIEIRQAHEPWPVITDVAHESGAVRLVDSSHERLEVLFRNSSAESPRLFCNGRNIDLHRLGNNWVAGIRYKRWRFKESVAPDSLAIKDLELSWETDGGEGAAVYRPGRVLGLEPPRMEQKRYAAAEGRLAVRPETVSGRWTVDLSRFPE